MGAIAKFIDKPMPEWEKEMIECYADHIVVDIEEMNSEQLQVFFMRLIYHAQNLCKGIVPERSKKDGVDIDKVLHKVYKKGGDKGCTN